MADQHYPESENRGALEREANSARERLTDIAVELSRRANPTAIKEQVRASAMEKKDDMKLRAREKYMDRRERVVQGAQQKRGLLSTLGAVAGGLGGGWLVKRLIDRSETSGRTFHAGYDYGYYGPTETPQVSRGAAYDTTGVGYGTTYGAGSTGYGTDTGYSAGYSAAGSGYAAGSEGPYTEGYEASSYGAESEEGGKLEHAKEKLQDVKHNVQEKVGHARERISHAAGDRMSHARERISDVSHRAGDLRGKVNRDNLYRARDWSSGQLQAHPLAFAISAFGLGMLASALFPVSEKERQLIEPAKEKARQQFSDLKHNVERKVEGLTHAFGSEQQAESSQQSGSFTAEERERRVDIIVPEDTPSVH